jgi:hypothetical protein
MHNARQIEEQESADYPIMSSTYTCRVPSPRESSKHGMEQAGAKKEREMPRVLPTTST